MYTYVPHVCTNVPRTFTYVPQICVYVLQMCCFILYDLFCLTFDIHFLFVIVSKILFNSCKHLKTEDDKREFLKYCLTFPDWESFTPGSPEVQAWFEKHPLSVYANSSELNWEKVSENINSSRYPFEGIGLWAFFFMLIATGQLTIEMILAGPRIRKRGQIPKLKKAAKVKVSAEENDLVHKERQKVHHKYVKLLTKLDLWVALPTRKIQFKKPLQAKKTPSPHASTKYIDEQADSSDDGIDAFVIEQDKRYMKVSKHGRGKLTSTPKSMNSVFEASDGEGAGEGVEGLRGIGRLQGMGARVLKEKVNNDVQVIVAPKTKKPSRI